MNLKKTKEGDLLTSLRLARPQLTYARALFLCKLYALKMNVNDDSFLEWLSDCLGLDSWDIDQEYYDFLNAEYAENQSLIEKIVKEFVEKEYAILEEIYQRILVLILTERRMNPTLDIAILINEAVEIAKLFTADKGYRVVNALAEKLLESVGSAQDMQNAKDAEDAKSAESAKSAENTEGAKSTEDGQDIEDAKNTENTEGAENTENDDQDTQSAEDRQDIEDTENTKGAESAEDRQDIEDAEDGQDIEDAKNTENTEGAEGAENTEDAENTESDGQDTQSTEDRQDIEDKRGTQGSENTESDGQDTQPS